jgi:hypothetical protein
MAKLSDGNGDQCISHLEEAKLIGCVVGPDNQRLDIADVDVAAGDGEG